MVALLDPRLPCAYVFLGFFLFHQMKTLRMHPLYTAKKHLMTYTLTWNSIYVKDCNDGAVVANALLDYAMRSVSMLTGTSSTAVAVAAVSERPGNNKALLLASFSSRILCPGRMVPASNSRLR
jgi:hypothetical protein